MPDWPFLAYYIRCNVFAEGSNSADLPDRLANLIMMSVEHYKNYESLFQNVFRQRESVNVRVRGMFITNRFCDFLFYGYPCTTNENMTLLCWKIMEFNLLIKHILIYVTCKFETLIFKSAQVIKYYMMFAFLFVQTAYSMSD